VEKNMSLMQGPGLMLAINFPVMAPNTVVESDCIVRVIIIKTSDRMRKIAS